MIIDKALEVKKFYDINYFPMPYSAQAVKNYQGLNRYISFISKSIQQSSSVLDAGCGTGFITNYLAYTYSKKKFTGVDFAGSIDHAKQIKQELGLTNLSFVKDDLTKFNSAKKFDAVICQGVLHHIPEYKQVLVRLKNMLSDDGIFVIGLYHPWGKTLQKIMPNNYHNKTLEIDQEQHPFELSFWGGDVKKMFDGYKFINKHPSVLCNYRNGGLTTYVFQKENLNGLD